MALYSHSKTEKNKVAILGGGLTGLVLSLRLTNLGYRVVVYEKEKAFGGLAGSMKVGKKWVDKHYHHIFPDDEKTLGLFRELGLHRSIKFYSVKSAVYQGGILAKFSAPKDLITLPILRTISRFRLGLSSLLIAKFGNPNLMNRFTAEKIIKTLMGRRVWDKFWGPLFVGKFGREARLVSGAWFWARLAGRNSVRNKKGELFGYPKKGFKQFTDKIIQDVEKNGVKLISGLEVKKIKKNDSGYQVDGENFDIVISTVAEPILVEIAPFLKLPKISYTGFIGAVVISRRPFSDYYWTSILEEDSPFGVVVEQTNLTPEIIGKDRYLTYLGKYLSCDDELFQKSEFEIGCELAKKMEQIYPGGTRSIEEITIVKEKYAQPVIREKFEASNPQIEKKFFFTSLAQTYPLDRGVNQAIESADRIVNLIQKSPRD